MKREIEDMTSHHWFAQTLGFDCVDGNGEVDTCIEDQLETRVGKPHLIKVPIEDWTEDDLCDFIEVYHDLAARPTCGWFHSYADCGFHPQRFHQSSGQRIYRWRLNKCLDASGLDLRLAEEGEDVGRVTRVLASGLDSLASEMVRDLATNEPEVPHAIALFRRHGSSREDRRTAVVTLTRVLEARRQAMKAHLLTRDEDALFQIANKFDLRHRNTSQMSDYRDEYLDWIFHWYLATIQLIEAIGQAVSTDD